MRPEEKSEARHCSTVKIACFDEPKPIDRHAVAIAGFMGLEVEILKEVPAQPVAGPLLLSADTLAALHRRSGAGEVAHLLASSDKVLVYGLRAGGDHDSILQHITKGGLSRVVEVPSGSPFQVNGTQREICTQFSGAEVGASDGRFDHALAGEQTGVTALVTLLQRPIFARIPSGSGSLWLLACSEVAGLDTPVTRDTPRMSFFSRVVPLMMFLRVTTGNAGWHNNRPTSCLIIDDPLLRKNYGFLNYEALLQVMQRERFSMALAFIPWNFRRSDQEAVKLFKEHSKHYSICVHGCDHTRGEFGTGDLPALEALAQLALERMASLQQDTGLPFEDVMVFPQGIFSESAPPALQKAGYLAAINTSGYPHDRADFTLSLRELLSVAITRFSGFPLFLRNYPQNWTEALFDLFLGKPAFLVEHHVYFKDRYEAAADLARKLHRAEPRLQWASPGEICQHAHLEKQLSNGDTAIDFFTDRFTLSNQTSVPRRYQLTQASVGAPPIDRITINSASVEFANRSGNTSLTVEVAAGATIQLRVERPPAKIARAPKKSVLSKLRIFARRHLSEFRDNHVHTNKALKSHRS